MNRPIAPPILPLPSKDAFQNDLLRALNAFHFELTAQLNTQVQGPGAPVASGDAIYVSSPIHHVTGTAEINRIEAPVGFTGPVWLIADGGWTLGTSGNIGSPATPKANTVLMVVYDGYKWFPAA